jgi:hypothetical protein
MRLKKKLYLCYYSSFSTGPSNQSRQVQFFEYRTVTGWQFQECRCLCRSVSGHVRTSCSARGQREPKPQAPPGWTAATNPPPPLTTGSLLGPLRGLALQQHSTTPESCADPQFNDLRGWDLLFHRGVHLLVLLSNSCFLKQQKADHAVEPTNQPITPLSSCASWSWKEEALWFSSLELERGGATWIGNGSVERFHAGTKVKTSLRKEWL